MQDAIQIRQHNIKPHADIEVEIIQKQTGRMTFTLRINGGNIVDVSFVQYVDVKEKYSIKKGMYVETRRVQTQ